MQKKFIATGILLALTTIFTGGCAASTQTEGTIETGDAVTVVTTPTTEGKSVGDQLKDRVDEATPERFTPTSNKSFFNDDMHLTINQLDTSNDPIVFTYIFVNNGDNKVVAKDTFNVVTSEENVECSELYKELAENEGKEVEKGKGLMVAKCYKRNAEAGHAPAFEIQYAGETVVTLNTAAK